MLTTLGGESKKTMIDGEVARAKQLTEAALSADFQRAPRFSHALLPAMEEVGGTMQAGECFVADALVSAKAWMRVEKEE